MKRDRLPKVRHRNARRNWMRAPKHFGQILMAAICHICVTDSRRSQRACALTHSKHHERSRHPTDRPLLAAIALVEIADSLNSGVWASEGSLSFIVGGFSGFLLNESGADFAKHGWRAFALLMACAIFVFAAFSLAL